MFGFVSCATEVYDSNSKEAHGKIATDISVEQVKATGNENLSRGESKAPAMRTFKVEGAKGDMFLRYTAAAGISGKEFETSEANESRGKMITTDNFYDDYGLFMYEYAASQSWASINTTQMPKVVNERVLKGRSWRTNEYWPGAGSKLALYGYAPYNLADVTNLPTATTTGKPKFHYVVPTQAIDQKDLLVSEDDQYVSPSNIDGGVDVPGDYNAIKTLKFKHACTAVRIAVGDQMAPCTITKIAIKGVYGEADYNYGAGTNLNEGAWENYSPTLSNYTLTADLTVSATDQNKVINDGRYTFMLLPQIVPDNALLEIVLDDGEEHILTANIGGSIWEMGYSVTYFITTASVDEEYVLLVETSEAPVSMLGEDRTINIKSYKQTFYGSQVPVPWTLDFNSSEEILGTTSWFKSTNGIISSAKFDGTGSVIGENNSIKIAKQVERSKPWRSTHTKTLREAAQQGSESSPIDLSAGKQTANCYVVSAPGYYKFPLVYGNARNADGSANTNSYGTATFVDHNGVQIDNPYIYQTNGGRNVPDNACIVWQDAPCLVNPESLKLSSDKHYIEFQIEQKNICQGNCILAIRDSYNNIMWSWHIWVTDYNFDNTIEIHNYPSDNMLICQMAKYPVGMCDAETRVRDKRVLNFRIHQQEIGGKTSMVSLEQFGSDSLYVYGNNAIFYQWGRKDPMLPSNGMGNTDKPYYDNEYTFLFQSKNASTSDFIRNCFLMYAEYNALSLEYWNKGCISYNLNVVTINKTIYDPSPSGFKVPLPLIYTGFSTTGQNKTPTNSASAWDNGLYFYMQHQNDGPTDFFHAYGGRLSSLYSVNSLILYNTGGANASSAYRLWCVSGRIYPFACDGDTIYPIACALRPVKD